MNWEEACHILGVAPTASKQEIHEQYLYKVQILHPDWNLNKPLDIRKRAEEELKQINEAYNILKDSINNPVITPPKLDISPRKIRFKEVGLGEKKTANIEVKSVGGTYSKFWIDDSPAPWLRVTDVKSLTGELLPLEVKIEAVGIGKSDKPYACSLAMRLENAQTKAIDEAVVRVELRMKDSPGILKVEITKPFKFKVLTPGILGGSFEIHNTGRGLLQGHLFTTRPWLNVSSDLVKIGPSAKAIYTVTVNAKNQRRGFKDKAFINIITNGGNERVPVVLSVASDKVFHFLIYLVLGGLIPALFTIYQPYYFWGEVSLLWVSLIIYLFLLFGVVFKLHLSKRKGH